MLATKTTEFAIPDDIVPESAVREAAHAAEALSFQAEMAQQIQGRLLTLVREARQEARRTPQ